jgi:poly-gamma-glutamate synthesis protein (capsule biosynthesis protein)
MRTRRSGDIVIVSVHWGGNWGYEIPADQRQFAHELIKNADVSVIHGHSSHHPKAIEIYRNRPVLYGCGDFLTDYEGIRGYEEYRPNIALMYLADIDTASGDLAALEIVPFQIRRFQLMPPPSDDAAWVRQTLDFESRRFGTQILAMSEDRWALSW